MDIREFGGRRVAGEPVEHTSGADRGELLAVTDRDQLRAGALNKIGQRIEPRVIDHPRLVQDDRRVPVDLDYSRVCAGDQSVERERVSSEGRAVRSKALGCRPGYGYTDRVMAGLLLGVSSSVDHDALPGSGRADEDGKALRSGEHLQSGALLGAQWCANALCDFACCVGACSLADVSAGWLGEQLGAAFDRLLLGAHGERGHSPAFQREDSPVTDHLPRHGERLIGCHLSR